MKKMELSMIIGMAGAIVISSWTQFTGSLFDLQENVLRLHILANSDSMEDQLLKYEVRDSLIEASEDIFGTEYDSSNIIEENVIDKLPLIEHIAEKTIKENGFSYSVTAELVNMEFDAREYEDITMPAGFYDAVRVTIGEAKGQNWWCVMYPPLCVPTALDVESDKDIEKDCFTKEERKLLHHPEQYEVKFKCVEWFKKLSSKWS